MFIYGIFDCYQLVGTISSAQKHLERLEVKLNFDRIAKERFPPVVNLTNVKSVAGVGYFGRHQL